MRKVVLGDRPKENEDMIYLRNVPRDGIYTGIAPKVMNLNMTEWEDHYAATGVNLEMPSQPTIFASYSDETPLWRPEDNGTLTMHDPSRKRILEFDRSNVKKRVKFRVQKKDGTCLYWINYCAVPKEPFVNYITVREKNHDGTVTTSRQNSVVLKTEEDIQDTSLYQTVKAYTCVGFLDITDNKTGKVTTASIKGDEITPTLPNKLFSTYPWVDELTGLFSKTYVAHASKMKDIQTDLQNQLQTMLEDKRMESWRYQHNIQCEVTRVNKREVKEINPGYAVYDDIETKDANTPQSFSEIECPCIVSSNIVGADDDEFEPHDDEWYVNFNETTLVTLIHAMTLLSTETTRLPAISLIKTNAKHNDYVRVKAHTRNTADEMLSMNTYLDGGYPYTTNKFLTKVVKFDEPIEVKESDGFDCNGNTAKVTTLFAYCPEKDVFIGNSRTVVFPNDIQWIGEPYVYEED